MATTAAGLKAVADAHPEIHFKNGGLEEYFARLSPDKLPVYEDSLTPSSEGCYTSQIRVKQLHRKLENELLSSEKMLSCAAAQGLLAYPTEKLRQAWESLMLAQFHDALPGSSIRPVEEDTLCQLGHGLEIVSRIKTKAFFALSAGQAQVAEGESAILVFNPHPFTANMVVDCEVNLPAQNWNLSCMVPTVLQNGAPLPGQLEKEASSFEIDWRKRCVFRAVLPPFTMSRFDCRFEEKPERPALPTLPAKGAYEFKGERIAAKVNVKTGLMDELTVDGRQVLRTGAFRLLVMRDFYNSWGIGFESFDDDCGAFTLMDAESGSEFSGLGQLVAPSVRMVEDGAVRTVVEAVFHYRDSSACLTYKLPKTGLEIELEIKLIWLEKDRLLKLCLPTACQNGDFWGQTAFGRQRLGTDGTEQVMHKWCGLRNDGQNLGVCVVNDGIHGVNCQDREMRLSLVRSAGFGMSDFGGKEALVPGRMNERMDQGERLYRLWLCAGPAEEVFEGIDNRALLHNEKVACLGMNPAGQGATPLQGPVIDNGAVVLSAFKQAEDGHAYILRLYESGGEPQTANLRLFGCQVPLLFTPFEIKTLLFDPADKTCRETRLLEDLEC